MNTVCGYDIKSLIIFADAARKAGITESQLQDFVLNAKAAYDYGWQEAQTEFKKALEYVLEGAIA